MSLFNCSYRLLFYILLSFFKVSLFAQFSIDTTKLPLIMIDTENKFILDEPKIMARMCVVNDGQFNHTQESCNEYEGWIGIEIRGASSQNFDKKSYGVETRNADSSNNNVELLGLPRENDWVFHGPYSDKTLIRNALTFQIGRSLGHWAPRTRFFDLVINGQYQGVYVLMEKIKADKNRVNVAKLNSDVIDGENISGGYILKIDKFEGSGSRRFTGEFGDVFQIHYPQIEDINDQQVDYIQGFIKEFESSLKDHRFQDRSYLDYIDLTSFYDFLIINEIAKNVDGYRLSTFLHKDRDGRGDGKLRMGPLWDFNLSFGNANYCTGGEPSGWTLNFNQFCPKDRWTISYWWDRMLTDSVFTQGLIDRWFELREDLLSTDQLHSYIDAMVEEIGPAAHTNFNRWRVLNNYVWPNFFIGGTYEEEIQFLKNWLGERLRWLDDNMPHISQQVWGPYSVSNWKMYPNPFTDELHIDYLVYEPGEMNLQVFNLMGQPLHQMKWQAPESYLSSVRWDGRDKNGNPLAAGLYIYQLWLGNTLLDQGKIIKE